MQTDPLSGARAAGVTTLAHVWAITLASGAVLRYTSHDQDLTVAGQVYSATGAPFAAGAVQTSAGLNADQLEVTVAGLSADERAQIDAGAWDRAEVVFAEVDWSNPALGLRVLRTARIGAVSYTTAADGSAVALKVELMGLLARLQAPIHQVTTPTCRARLGDARCTVALGPLTVTGTLTSVTSRTAVADSARAEAAGHFSGGVLTWTSGLNAGLKSEVKAHTAGGALALLMPTPYTPAVGDAYSLVRGCDKTIATCAGVFSNALNFRGEPWVPGADAIVRVGGA
jgi:uncharacterized phage protein (TIGR02218 family)